MTLDPKGGLMVPCLLLPQRRYAQVQIRAKQVQAEAGAPEEKTEPDHKQAK